MRMSQSLRLLGETFFAEILDWGILPEWLQPEAVSGGLKYMTRAKVFF